MKLNILVLDDNAGNAHQSLHGAVQLLATDEQPIPYDPPWLVTVGSDLDLEVDFRIISNLPGARSALFDADKLKGFHVILLDNDWGGDKAAGLQLLEEMSNRRVPHPLLAIYTQHDSHDVITKALRLGARAIVKKEEKNHLLNLLFAAADHARLLDLEGKFVNILTGVDKGLETISQTMKNCLVDAAMYATRRNTPILLYGGSGTGKGVLARAIHKVSPRSRGPFESMDCTSIPASLAEATLFGHEKGAFTGAESARSGLFEQSHGGTLFIDELQALSHGLQDRLLKVLQEGMFRRVGGTSSQTCDVRIISATSEDPHKLREKNILQEALYHRISTGIVRVPSLSERAEDIPQLATRYLERLSHDDGRSAVRLTAAAEDALQRHEWPGNIRELQNTLERSFIRLQGHEMDVADLRFDTAHEYHKAEQTKVKPSLSIAKLLKLTPPRQNSNVRRLFELLIKRWPDSVSYKELHESIGLSDVDHQHAHATLMVRISQLNKKFEQTGFTVDRDDAGQGYRLTEVSN